MVPAPRARRERPAAAPPAEVVGPAAELPLAPPIASLTEAPAPPRRRAPAPTRAVTPAAEVVAPASPAPLVARVLAVDVALAPPDRPVVARVELGRGALVEPRQGPAYARGLVALSVALVAISVLLLAMGIGGGTTG